MYVATSSSLLVLHKDFLMAEFKFMQVKTTFDDKLNYLELINAALEQWPLLNCSLLFQQNETFSSRGSWSSIYGTRYIRYMYHLFTQTLH